MSIQEVKPLFDDPLASPELRNFVTLCSPNG